MSAVTIPPPVLPDPVVTLSHARVRGVSSILALTAIVSAALTAVGWYNAGAQQFAFSYLVAFVFLSSILLGSLFWVLIHHLTGAGWSVVVRRLAENNTRAFFLLILFAVPLLANLPVLFKWANPSAIQHSIHGPVVVAEDPLWAAKQPWLSTNFFIIRIIGYYAIWLIISQVMARLSAKQDTTGISRYSVRMQQISAPSMILLGMTSSFFAFDWIMSLEYHWFSTIFGVYYWAGSINCAMATLVLTTMALHASGRLRNTITIEHLHDMGKIMFGFTVFWTYIAFSQYFLYWYANIPEETSWYILRRTGGRLDGNWNTVSWCLLFGRFLFPFFLLLRRAAKRNKLVLTFAALWIMFIHYVDLYWEIMPNYMNEHTHPSGETGVFPHWLDLTCLVFLLSATAFWVVKREWTARPLIPVGDPRLAESLHHKNHW